MAGKRKKAAVVADQRVDVAEGGNPIGMLRPDPLNPREMLDASRQGLAVSMVEYGDLSVIVFNVRTGMIVAGHQRTAELEQAGATEFTRMPGPGPGTDVGRGYIDYPATGERFDVRFVDWPLEKQRQANVVANSRAIAGHFTSGVDALLASFQGGAPELFQQLHMGSMLAFEPADLPSMLPEGGAGGGGGAAPEVEEDEVPDVAPGPPDSVVGQVYGLGWCIQGTCSCGEQYCIDLTVEEARAMGLE